MNLERRRFVRVVGAGALVWAAQAGAAPPFAAPPGGLADPYGPWRAAGSGAVDARLHCLRYAILAPNPHNRQPWLIELRGRDEIVIHLDRSRLLPHTDPYARQLLVGHGAFLELLSLAASARGLQAQITLFPQGAYAEQPDDRPVAAVRLVAGAERAPRDPLFDRITERRTVRTGYDMQRPPTPEELRAVTAAATPSPATALRAAWTLDAGRLAAIRAIATEAWDIELTTPHTLQESVDLTRIGPREIARNPDGVSLGGLFYTALGWLGLLTREKSAQPGSRAHQGMLDHGRASLRDTPAFVWLVTPDNTRQAQIGAGRAYVRAQLAATALGLSMQPVSQALQEYAEVRGPYRRLKQQLDAPGAACVQMLARIGRAPAPARPSPRWALQTRLLPGRSATAT